MTSIGFNYTRTNYKQRQNEFQNSIFTLLSLLKNRFKPFFLMESDLNFLLFIVILSIYLPSFKSKSFLLVGETIFSFIPLLFQVGITDWQELASTRHKQRQNDGQNSNLKLLSLLKNRFKPFFDGIWFIRLGIEFSTVYSDSCYLFEIHSNPNHFFY